MDNFYRLVYIKGISRFDTWRFANKTAQYTYFNSFTNNNSYKVEEYFPPHYTNTIKFDRTEIDYTQYNYNYCLLYFNEKYYCYFIDNITYINEDVYELNLTLDTIQTFMFDVNFTYATLDRLSIKRWDNPTNLTINRNYKRENLSNEEFFTDYYNEEGYFKFFLLVQCSSVVFDALPSYPVPAGVISQQILRGNLVSSGFQYVLIPMISYTDAMDCNYAFNYVKIYENDDTTEKFTLQPITSKSFDYLIKSPNVQNIYLINDYHLRSYLTRTITDNVVDTAVGYTFLRQYTDIRIDTSLINVIPCHIESTSNNVTYGIYINDINTLINKSSLVKPINFEVNHSKTASFNKKYIPQLLDENYIQLYFGEKVNLATYPLYKSNEIGFNEYDYYDLYTGERMYNILPNGEAYDRYNTTINVASMEKYEMANDAWANYESRNRATLTTGRALNTFNSFFAPILGSGAKGLDNPALLRTKTGLNVVNNQMNYVITKENLLYTPDTLKQGNNCLMDIMNKATKVIHRVDMVKDIDNVAKLLEEFGYAVDLTYNNVNIFDINIRYYYNVVRCKNLQIDATSCIIGETLKEDFVSRLRDGLRLWNNENNTNMYDNINYDNVENDFIIE